MTNRPEALNLAVERVKSVQAIGEERRVLAGDDTYTVEAWKVRGTSMKKVGESDGVYYDNLREIVTSLTGLYHSL